MSFYKSHVMKFSALPNGNDYIDLSSSRGEKDQFQDYHIQSRQRTHPKEMKNSLMALEENFLLEIDDLLESRQLIGVTGHIGQIFHTGCNSSRVYEDVDYDDSYKPVCNCAYDSFYQEWAVVCTLNDEKGVCDTNSTEAVENCVGTKEIFYFSDRTGKLSNKISCTVCQHQNQTNCGDFLTSCTQVVFNEDEKPYNCILERAGADTICDDCSICDSKSNSTGEFSFGIKHSCFDNPTNGCDTESFAHQHNFESTIKSGLPAIGGQFSKVCSSRNLEKSLYSTVQYTAGFATICECRDPSFGIVICDIHNDRCHANLCTEVSEKFFFRETDGEYEKKWTLNMSTGLMTEATFHPDSGSATSCSILAEVNNKLEQCRNCQICQDGSGNTGIAYNCFGEKQKGSCDTSSGRTLNNFFVQTPKPTPSQKTSSDKRMPIIVGVSFGCAALLAIMFLAFLLRRSFASQEQSTTNNFNDDETVAESVAPSEAQFSPDDLMLDEESSVPVARASTSPEEVEEMPVEKAILT